MSQSATITNIANRLVTLLQKIDGGADYYNAVNHNNIKIGFQMYDQAGAYPSIYLSSFSTPRSVAGDQVTFNTELEVEIFGYISNEAAPLEKVIQLGSDMEKAIYTDPELDDNVWDLSLSMSMTSFQSYGIVRLTITAQMTYTIY